MTSDSPELPVPRPRTRDLAKVVEIHNAGCIVQFLHDGSTAEARWADSIQRRGGGVHPCHLVVVAAREADSSPDSTPYEVVWRGPAVATVTSVDGGRVTYDTGYPPDRGVTRTLRDVRPADERQAIRAGQQVVVAPSVDDPGAAALLDIAVDGRPLHPDRLRDVVLDRAQRASRPGSVAGAGSEARPAAEEDPRRVVAVGYDRMAERYAAWTAAGGANDVRPRYAARFLERLPAGARILELGCGGGGPTTQQLAARFALTGLDISARQIELARANVPGATFVHGDMTRIDFPPGSFDGVAAFYAFLHLPHGELPGLLRKIGAWLRPGGVLVATLAAGADRGTIEPDWLGVPMYFSGVAPADARRYLHVAGLQIETFQNETILEDGHPVTFLWVVACKPDEAECGTAPQPKR